MTAAARLAETLASRYADDPDALRLLEILAPVEPGQRSQETRARLAERDRLIREAIAAHYASMKPEPAARELHRAMARYAAAGWPRERHLAECPQRHHGTVRSFLWRIFRLEDRTLSVSRIRQIRRNQPEILSTSSPYSLTEKSPIFEMNKGD